MIKVNVEKKQEKNEKDNRTSQELDLASVAV